MKRKLCSECGDDAAISLCQILSTVGTTPRKQRCTTATAFCAACLQSRVKLLRRLGLQGLHKPLGEAFTALADDSGMQLTRQKRSVSAESAECA
jgi:hypothetical protein